MNGFSLDSYHKHTNSFKSNDYTSRFGISISRIGHYGYYTGRKILDKFIHKRLVDESDSVDPIFAVPQALEQENVENGKLYASRSKLIA